MMLAGCTHEAQRSQLFLLGSPAEYTYLNKNQCYTVDRMNDKEEWKEVQESMLAIGMSQDEILEILKILSAVLWLGQIEFQQDGSIDKSKITNQLPVERIAKLLGCDIKLLGQGMISRTFSANNSSVLTPLNPDGARYTRDAMAKTIYFRLFDYIVYRINQAIETPEMNSAATSKQKTKSLRTIGVLDIYGFEIFQSNSLSVKAQHKCE